jgi:hypothetical protein
MRQSKLARPSVFKSLDFLCGVEEKKKKKMNRNPNQTKLNQPTNQTNKKPTKNSDNTAIVPNPWYVQASQSFAGLKVHKELLVMVHGLQRSIIEYLLTTSMLPGIL